MTTDIELYELYYEPATEIPYMQKRNNNLNYKNVSVISKYLPNANIDKIAILTFEETKDTIKIVNYFGSLIQDGQPYGYKPTIPQEIDKYINKANQYLFDVNEEKNKTIEGMKEIENDNTIIIDDKRKHYNALNPRIEYTNFTIFFEFDNKYVPIIFNKNYFLSKKENVNKRIMPVPYKYLCVAPWLDKLLLEDLNLLHIYHAAIDDDDDDETKEMKLYIVKKYIPKLIFRPWMNGIAFWPMKKDDVYTSKFREFIDVFKDVPKGIKPDIIVRDEKENPYLLNSDVKRHLVFQYKQDGDIKYEVKLTPEGPQTYNKRTKNKYSSNSYILYSLNDKVIYEDKSNDYAKYDLLNLKLYLNFNSVLKALYLEKKVDEAVELHRQTIYVPYFDFINLEFNHVNTDKQVPLYLISLYDLPSLMSRQKSIDQISNKYTIYYKLKSTNDSSKNVAIDVSRMIWTNIKYNDVEYTKIQSHFTTEDVLTLEKLQHICTVYKNLILFRKGIATDIDEYILDNTLICRDGAYSKDMQQVPYTSSFKVYIDKSSSYSYEHIYLIPAISMHPSGFEYVRRTFPLYYKININNTDLLNTSKNVKKDVIITSISRMYKNDEVQKYDLKSSIVLKGIDMLDLKQSYDDNSIFNIYEYKGKLYIEKIQKSQPNVGGKGVFKKTEEKQKLLGRERCIYTQGRKKFIKVKGEFVPISSIKASKVKK